MLSQFWFLGLGFKKGMLEVCGACVWSTLVFVICKVIASL